MEMHKMTDCDASKATCPQSSLGGLSAAFADVLAFHRKFGQVVGQTPAVPPPGTLALRLAMIDEEYDELDAALAIGDLPGIADAACDLIYVVLGTLVSYGIDAAPVWAAIQEANMAKIGGGRSEAGKIQKPAGWKHPDIWAILAGQAPLDGSGRFIRDQSPEPPETSADPITYDPRTGCFSRMHTEAEIAGWTRDNLENLRRMGIDSSAMLPFAGQPPLGGVEGGGR